jgi:hypothetical protein
MNVVISQVYIDPDAIYPFNFRFQRFLSESISMLSKSTKRFEDVYGSEWRVIIRLSAKSGLPSAELQGPTLFKRKKDVEYTLFLPFPLLLSDGNTDIRRVVELIVDGVTEVLGRLGLDSTGVCEKKHLIVNRVVSDKTFLN